MLTYNRAGLKRFYKSITGHIIGGIITGTAAYFSGSPYWLLLEPVIQSVISALAKRLREKYNIETVL